jgi:hypothetical protein
MDARSGSGQSRGVEHVEDVEVHAGLLGVRLRAREQDICATIWVRIREGIPDPVRDRDPNRVAVLRSTIATVVDFGLSLIERAQTQLDDLPTGAWESVRVGARSGGALSIPLRGYLTGHLVMWEFIVEEAEALSIGDRARVALLKRASLIESTYYQRLIDVASDEYMSELERVTRGREQRRPQLIRELLEGSEVSELELGYRLAGHHVGMIVSAPEPEGLAHQIASMLDCQLLTLSRSERTLWLWLGGMRPLDGRGIAAVVDGLTDADLRVAIGEGAHGARGFRLTHRQACAAHAVAQRTSARVTRYADVALLALALHDEALGATLPAVYLAPLDADPGRAEILRETIRAYFAAGHNATSAAAALGVHERTVSARIRAAEALLGYPLNVHRAELETALRIEQLAAGT